MVKYSFLYRIGLFFRSLLFSIYMIISVTIYSFLCVMAWPLPLRYRYVLVTGWTASVVWMLKVLCGIDYHVEGLENIIKDRNGVVLSKHQSTWETLYLPTIFHQAAIIVKRELLWVPFFGWGLATIDPIAINRSNATSSMDQIIKKGKKCLSRGRWILMFPEGTRIAPGKVGHYRLGGARLAVASGYPVIPVAHNAGCFWPKRGFLKKPGTIKVVIGPLIETKNRTPEEVMTQTRNWIEETMLRLD